MRYELTKLITSCNHHVEISHEYFETLKSKKEFLIEALFVEEKFNLVLENYSEFELELLGNSVRNMLFHDFEWSSGVNDIHSINRRIINLLTTCRLYMDQVCHNIHTIYGSGSAQAIAFKTQSSNEYDSVFGYRVMEAMRNYVQHRGLPIERVDNKLQWLENSDEKRCKRTIKLIIDVATIAQDRKFKASVLTELQAQGNLVEFTPLVRQYIESIGRIHLKVRDLIGVELLESDNSLLQAINLYQESTNDRLDNFVHAVALSIDSNNRVESVEIFNDFIERRKMLERKNNYPHYSLHFVSSEAPEL
jgi:hypothetical protein